MNIHQYYRQAAFTALNNSLAALVPIIIMILPLYMLFTNSKILLFSIPFLVYSFIAYQSYILHRERSSATANTFKIENNLVPFEKNQYLLVFMPAPSLRMLLFNPNGTIKGEIRDLRFSKLRWYLPYFIDRMIPAEYGFFNREKKLQLTMKWSKGQCEVRDRKGTCAFTIEETGTNEFQLNDNLFIRLDSKTLYTDVQFVNGEGSVIARVRKGWMPLEWSPYIKDANTPVLSFDEGLSKQEQLFIFAILIKIYRYRNH
ncbi:hypothetical protein [Robertmurraya kyonggiensis]|uniref:Uncharacterized protein n=1 Tax=Robertmurraya kyonggiensis TaxID=1037680 RepID=A0A4U1DBW5_9BACI|nr:hypothetical protein [Robertmurraya kyonggiensis]TKC19563.1 hypothetical protein FA727_08485 [Robertmurraya kyonggiensis]